MACQCSFSRTYLNKFLKIEGFTILQQNVPTLTTFLAFSFFPGDIKIGFVAKLEVARKFQERYQIEDFSTVLFLLMTVFIWATPYGH